MDSFIPVPSSESPEENEKKDTESSSTFSWSALSWGSITQTIKETSQQVVEIYKE
jgi:hypothetical protein